MLWNILIIFVILFSESELIRYPLSLSASSSTLKPIPYLRTYYTTQRMYPFTPANSLNSADIALENLEQFEKNQNHLVVNDIKTLQQIARMTNQNLQSMTTYHKQLSDYYNHEQTEKSGSNEQVISDPDNHLWPSHKFIDKNFKDEGQWYDDHSDMDYNTEDPKIESTFQSTHAEFHKISNNLNDTHISEVINDSTLHSLEGKIGFGLGLSLLFLLLIILMYIIYREWLQRYLQSKNDSNHNSYNRDFCFDCDFARKMTLKKITNISIRKLQNHYDDEIDRCHKHIPDIENLWLLEKSRLVVFHEMKLGSGAVCNVYKGAIEGLAPICKVNPSLAAFGIFKDCMCAVKMLPSTADDTGHADFMQEIKFMKSLKYHPHLVSMLGVSIDDNGNIMLLIEYCDLGDLLHLVRNKRGEIIMNQTNEHSKLRIKDLVTFAWQISNGLEYLSSIGCVHRDVAARNIFVNAANICKIADFGFCRLSDSFIYADRGRRLPLRWMAPESLRSYEYSIKSDVWSYGVLLYEIFSFGEVPYALLQTSEILEFLNSGARLSQPQYCPVDIYTVMLQCWQNEPSLRPTFAEICSILRRILEDNFGHYGYMKTINENNNSID